MTKKYVYFFGEGYAEGDAGMKDLLGGKGANLAEMTRLGIPVPPGFTVTTEVCAYYFEHNLRYPPYLREQVEKSITHVERIMGSRFGWARNPLLFSVRSGARVSMPGMMDTVLNMGLNFETVEGLAQRTGNSRFAWDAFRRFIQMYANVVMGVPSEVFEHVLEEMKRKRKAERDTDLEAEDLIQLVKLYFERLMKQGKKFPLNPLEQLWGGISAVFSSWNTPRAITYRRLNNIPETWGTACNVQAMVFGNMGKNSATGVAFTRDPATGKKRFFGEWLPDAQGEDVVAGIRTPYPISMDSKKSPDQLSLEEYLPGCYHQLVRIYNRLEKHYRDMQDIEFTIQTGKLWMLQTRTGKRTGLAAVRMAVEMVEEGLIDQEEAVRRVDAEAMIQLLAPIFSPGEKKEAIQKGRLLARGLNAGPGAASGRIAFNAEDAERLSRNDPVILVRLETSPDDIHGMAVARGILTARGGMTSHAALVARGMGKPCVVGCGELIINYARKQMTVKGRTFRQGDYLSLDGSTGEVIQGKLETYPSEVVQVLIEKKMKPGRSTVFGQFGKILSWADQVRKIGVRCNADTPRDAAAGRAFGAEGIGLCRTEHMFFEGKRIDAVREMILAEDTEGRWKALKKILPMQKGDFIGIYKAMPGLPITIRLLDPPLHEFLPATDKEINDLAKKMKVPQSRLKAKVSQLHELNPMLGLRGCRLGIIYPEIYDLQVRAIMEAACEVSRGGNKPVKPEIMIPLVGHIRELAMIRGRAEKICREVMKQYEVNLEYLIGTMIEIPRAAITADEVAREAEFFSFGTNDLTQTALGMSRDDAGSFLPDYVRMGIYGNDPFASIDQEGVGQLMVIGVQKGREARPDLKVGICGEHGGESGSVKFCHKIGLDYVSCSPYRVPVARMAAAQAALQEKAELEEKLKAEAEAKKPKKAKKKKPEEEAAKPVRRPIPFPAKAKALKEAAKKKEKEAKPEKKKEVKPKKSAKPSEKPKKKPTPKKKPAAKKAARPSKKPKKKPAPKKKPKTKKAIKPKKKPAAKKAVKTKARPKPKKALKPKKKAKPAARAKKALKKKKR
jgi:pyruvate,orthophosphate dikinase